MANPYESLHELPLDIADWKRLDLITQATKLGKAIETKGFCAINGFADDKVKKLAEKEARDLKRAGFMKRLPVEATHAYLGEVASAHIMHLQDLDDEEDQGDPPLPRENLHKFEAHLHEVGTAVVRSGRSSCGEIVGHTPGIVHFAKIPEDRAAPPLLDPKEAAKHVAMAATRKITLLYFLGPSSVVINLTPLEELRNTLRVMSRRPVVIAFRNDVVRINFSMKGVGVTMQVDYLMRRFSSNSMRARDILPGQLADWFKDRMEAIAENTDDPIDSIPMEFLREAHLTLHKGKVPIRIVETWIDLPSLPKFSGGVAPFNATIIGGQDPVTEICKPRHQCDPAEQTMWSWGGKWDPEEYYDPDPLNASDFKMYTRHYAVMNRNCAFDIDFDPMDYDINNVEELSLDPRARLLLESNKLLWKKAGDDYQPNREDIGIFVGMAGENQYWNFMKSEAKINKFSARNLSNATMVARLPYHFKTTGPAILVDTEDSSGLVALDTCCHYLWEDRCGPWAFTSAVQWIANPFETILQCAAGVIAKSSRTRVWDESADGFTKGEGVVTLLTERHDRVKIKKQTAFSFLTQANVDATADPYRAVIVGSGLNSKGVSSSLTAPSATAFQDCAGRAEAMAKKSFKLNDAIEANASGSRLVDMVELGFIRKLIAVPPTNAQAVSVRAAKATFGSLGPVSGLASVARCTYLFQIMLHGPTIHLHQLMDCSSLTDDDSTSERMLHLTEAIEAASYNQRPVFSPSGIQATNSQMMLWGHKHTNQQGQRAPKDITWWPTAPVPKNVLQPLKGYYIVGTWTAWTQPIKMEQVEDGTWAYTLVMGENNWECFHIWQDHDPNLCLHPSTCRADRDTTVIGPDKSGREHCWYISGKPANMRLINEVQEERLKAAMERGEEPPDPEENYVVTFLGDSKPKGYENVEEPQDMPLVDTNSEMKGKPGDKYQIKLSLRGKYTRLDWSKVKKPRRGQQEVEAETETPYLHKYCIIGDHNYWTFQDMEPLEGEEGVYQVEVQLLRDKTSFQIYRDRDWDQGFYPSQTTTSHEALVRGPDERGHGKNWEIHGKAGDRFRVEIRRQYANDEDYKRVRWEFMEHDVVNFDEISKHHKYCYVSSASGFRSVIEMKPNDKRTRFSHETRLGKTGIEYFQIILNGNWLAAVHPNTNEATQYDKGVIVEGPNDGGADKYWAIGVHDKDKEKLGPREWVTVHLELKNGMPHKVWWERYESLDAHNERLAWGCQQIFQRHCRMLGFIPWRSNDRPAQVVSKPLFLDAVDGKVGNPTMPLSVLADEEDSEDEEMLALPPVPAEE
eukprot:CAMPEP_0115605596 /NCGR_PEP_ID=MMETSP0272-20121206/17545_1 /TAXON_ID=71861 /ORGANISM="Scrippsiella trochoidea, Strain CCMP3099" /LENGTH=1305 /DNA_ID=CAMNT_0003041195 /DNA_START=17 /DNA_END=3933 /DNA_ORIENTATION=+